MKKYLVGTSEEFNDLKIVYAESEESAIFKYKEALQPDDLFLDDLHDWSTNMSFSERFHYDEESDGQEDLPADEIMWRIQSYFKERPEYISIYWKHWTGQVKGDTEKNKMAHFPQEMIEWIWRKVLEEGNWTSFRAICLDRMKEIH